MKAYEGRLIGLGVAVAFAVITYIIIPLIKAIYRWLSSRSRRSFTPSYNNYSRRPIAITIVGVLGILASSLILVAGFAELYNGFLKVSILLVVLLGLVGLIGSFMLFRMKRIAAIILLVLLLLCNLFAVYYSIEYKEPFPILGTFIASIVPCWVLLKYLPDMD